MSFDIFLKAPVGLMPVLMYSAILLYMDVYKLERSYVVVWVIFGGGLTAVASYAANGFLLDVFHMDFKTYARYMAPVVEESLKGLIIVFLFHSSRIGFLVDSAIMGFAVGAGFAFVENLYYLYLVPDANFGVWIVRGLGTAIMHGGATAIFAIMTQALTEGHSRVHPLLYLPGLAVATLIHSVFNHFPVSPIFSTLGALVAIPLILALVFRKSTGLMHDWLQVDFDADEKLFEKIQKGVFIKSDTGRFLLDLRDKFDGLVVADMLCYIRLHTELTMRAKSMLMAREFGLEVEMGENIRLKFNELRSLERSIGKVGFMAMKPYVHVSRKSLWQLFLIDR
jgi:RsiW-degrading membrane proteinase PrsW (M82 family)